MAKKSKHGSHVVKSFNEVADRIFAIFDAIAEVPDDHQAVTIMVTMLNALNGAVIRAAERGTKHK